ncbi:MAG: transketolase [Planctomycetota bacterium]
MTTTEVDIQQLAINTIRTLSMDAVQQANSGHPGTPMALAPITYALWAKHMKYDPANPSWVARDRFVLSCGHASMLLYSMLHLSEVQATEDRQPTGRPSITLKDIRNFRQLHSPCAGHPEFGEAAGIETTTGPLGQGVSNSVGMAIASKWIGARYDRDGHNLFDYNVWALCSDGDIMEGVACEAASLAGHLGLDNLCWIYDDNKITIEGDTDLAFSEDVQKRFEGLGWHVVCVEDANDLGALDSAFEAFASCNDRPTLVIVRSVIGYGAPNKAGSHDAHGAPLGDEEIALTKQNYGWPDDQKFYVPEEVMEHFREVSGKRGAEDYASWEEKHQKYQADHPELATQLSTMFSGRLPEGWDSDIPEFEASEKGDATRNTSGKVLNAMAAAIPWLVGGSADLAGSNKTNINDADAGHFSRNEYSGRNFHFGIREHAMAAAANGMNLSGLRTYCATFFVFTDYLRPSMRLSGLMHQPVIYIMTHDSIGLGEDGPTHQPVEHLAAVRAIPNLLVIRPGDANEVSAAYRVALSQSNRPSVLVLTRQAVPTLDRSKYGSVDGAMKGAYIVQDCDGTPDVILMGSGSELTLCMEAAETLTSQGRKVRVVSMFCMELFDEQDEAYRNQVLPAEVTKRVGVEAGLETGWWKYLGASGSFIGMTGFGASAPYKTLYEHFGITADAVVAAANS